MMMITKPVSLQIPEMVEGESESQIIATMPNTLLPKHISGKLLAWNSERTVEELLS